MSVERCAWCARMVSWVLAWFGGLQIYNHEFIVAGAVLVGALGCALLAMEWFDHDTVHRLMSEDGTKAP